MQLGEGEVIVLELRFRRDEVIYLRDKIHVGVPLYCFCKDFNLD